MHPDTYTLPTHMRQLGLTMLGRAVHHAVFMDMVNPYYDAIGVLHAAQAAEVILKACIAAQHPLLIFSKLPKPAAEEEGHLDIERLMKHGRTLQFAELPSTLWATTGFRIPNESLFRDFGELRNTIQHLGVPSADLSRQTLEFIIGVVDPVIQEFWATNIFHHVVFDEIEYLIDVLERRDIEYDGWVPDDRERFSPNHPLWLFAPWEHTVTNEVVWVDDHLPNQLKILLDSDFQRHAKAATQPERWLSDWAEIIKPKRPQ